MALIKCPECQGMMSTTAQSCPHCGAVVLRCPKCGSKNVKVISGASKAASVAVWGVFAMNKVVSKYVCKDCSHKF